jgi:HSP20 family protein
LQNTINRKGKIKEENTVKFSGPVSNLLNIQDGFNRTIENFLKGYNDDIFDNSWRPATDISENDDRFEIKAELPGLKKGDVKIKMVDNVLFITGEKKQEKEEKEKSYHLVECSYGAFERRFALEGKVENDKIKADFKDGVLRITVPKSAEVKPKEIEVKVQ